MKNDQGTHRAGALLLGGAILCCVVPGRAAIFPVGFPQETAGWYQGITWQGAAAGSIEVFVDSDQGGGPLALPGLDFAVDIDADGTDDFVNAAWTAQLVNPTYVLATGPAVGSLFADIHFVGNGAGNAAPVTVDVLVWSGAPMTSSLLGTGKALLGLPGALAAINPNLGDVAGYDRTAVPDGGATLAMMGLAALGLAFVGRRGAWMRASNGSWTAAHSGVGSSYTSSDMAGRRTSASREFDGTTHCKVNT